MGWKTRAHLAETWSALWEHKVSLCRKTRSVFRAPTRLLRYRLHELNSNMLGDSWSLVSNSVLNLQGQRWLHVHFHVWHLTEAFIVLHSCICHLKHWVVLYRDRCAAEQHEWRPRRRPVFQTSSSTLYISWTGRVNRHPQSITCYYPSGPHLCLDKSSVGCALCLLCFRCKWCRSSCVQHGRCQDAQSCRFSSKLSREYESFMYGRCDPSPSHFALKHESWISGFSNSSDSRTPSDGWGAELHPEFIARLRYLVLLVVVFFYKTWSVLEAHPAWVSVSPLICGEGGDNKLWNRWKEIRVP